MNERIKSIIFGTIGFLGFLLIFPINLTAISASLAYTNIATFPAVASVLGFAPVIMLIEGLGSSGYMIVQGVRDKVSSTLNLMDMVWAVIGSFVFFTFFPLMLGGLYTIFTAMNGTYTGAEIVPIFGIVILGSGFGGAGFAMVRATGHWRGNKNGGKHKKGKRN